MRKIYYNITFYSPGTFFSESSSIDFPILDYSLITEKAKEIKERYNSSPYGFCWKKLQVPADLPVIDGFQVKVDPVILEKSGTVYITGEIVLAKNVTDKNDLIMKSNLEHNSGGIGVTNCNSWKFNGFFSEEDEIIDWSGKVIRRGNDLDLMKIRAENEEIIKSRYEN